VIILKFSSANILVDASKRILPFQASLSESRPSKQQFYAPLKKMGTNSLSVAVFGSLSRRRSSVTAAFLRRIANKVLRSAVRSRTRALAPPTFEAVRTRTRIA